jgi:hypothetical protein
LHQIAGVGRQILGDTDGRGVGTVCGAERVVDVEIGQGRESPREFGVVLLLARFEADVLEEEDFTRFQRTRCRPRLRTGDILGLDNVAPQNLSQMLSYRGETELGRGFAFRPAEVTDEDNRGTAREQVLDRRQRGADTGVVGDPSVLHRNVEVDADEDTLACHVGVADRAIAHVLLRRDRARVR